MTCTLFFPFMLKSLYQEYHKLGCCWFSYPQVHDHYWWCGMILHSLQSMCLWWKGRNVHNQLCIFCSFSVSFFQYLEEISLSKPHTWTKLHFFKIGKGHFYMFIIAIFILNGCFCSLINGFLLVTLNDFVAVFAPAKHFPPKQHFSPDDSSFFSFVGTPWLCGHIFHSFDRFPWIAWWIQTSFPLTTSGVQTRPSLLLLWYHVCFWVSCSRHSTFDRSLQWSAYHLFHTLVLFRKICHHMENEIVITIGLHQTGSSIWL